MDAELTVGFLAFKESYVSKVTCTPFTSVEVRLAVFIVLATSQTLSFASGRSVFLDALIQIIIHNLALPTGIPKFPPP